MNRSGQIILVLISVLFTAYQTVMKQEPFLTVDFFIFTLIAFFVGRQYDLARFYAKKAKLKDESYKKLVDSFPELIVIHEKYKICYVNDAALKMIGAKNKEELIGRTILEFIVPKYKGRVEERIKMTKKEDSPLSNIQYELIRIDGTTFFFEGSSMNISFGKNDATLTIGKDITEKKEQTEKLLLKSEKLALLGQMAAGIAHEIRNPLTSIKGFVQLFKSNLLQEEYYNIVLSELDRINAIVGEFLVLSKPSASIYVEKDLNELMKDVMTLMNSQLMLNNVQIFSELDSNISKICCEEAQLKQVFLNLFKNAIEAMPNGGNIYLKVKESDEGRILIKVIDEGVGIPPERIPTLGEPFYTTKEKGTGLGLMTCYKIIESHKGQLSIHSEVNKGTTIEIVLPTMTQPLLKREFV